MAAQRKTKSRASTQGPEWSTPPDGVLEAVVGMLRPSDTAVLRLVCRGWRVAQGRVITRLAPTSDILTLVEYSKLFPNLRSLDLRGVKLFDPSRLPVGLSLDNPCALKELNLGGCKQFRVGDLSRLVDVLPSLTSLSLAGCCELPAAELAHLTRLSDLRSVDLSHCDGVDRVGLSHLASLRQLEQLRLIDCDSVGDDALTNLAGSTASKTLQYIDLSGCASVTDRGVSEGIAACSSLRTLRLKCCELVSDVGVAAVAAGCQRLQSLDLGWCGVTDTSLDVLADVLPMLKTLNLSWCDRITDAGLASLAYATQLLELKLKGCVRITDAGLHALSRLPSLQLLNLRLCVQVCLPALETLEAKLRKQQLLKFTCSASSLDEVTPRRFVGADRDDDDDPVIRIPEEPALGESGIVLQSSPNAQPLALTRIC